jgi:cell division protein FtsB
VSARTYRVAPRRRVGGRPASRIHWDKLGRVVLVLVLFGILVSYVEPALHFVQVWRDHGSQQTQLEQLKREHAALQARASSVNDGAKVEREARKLGMVSPGEQPYVIRGLGGR